MIARPYVIDSMSVLRQLLAKKLEQSDKTWRNFSFSPAIGSIFLFPVGNEEVEKIVTAPYPSISTGLNCMSIKILKSMLTVILTHLTELINNSFSRGVFPDCPTSQTDSENSHANCF